MLLENGSECDTVNYEISFVNLCTVCWYISVISCYSTTKYERVHLRNVAISNKCILVTITTVGGTADGQLKVNCT